MKETNKKIIVLSLVFMLAFSPVLAIPARAQWVVWDPGNFVPNMFTAVNTAVDTVADIDTAINTTVAGPVKEFGLDSIAWLIVNMVIERMAASTVNWINSGFKGSPAFVTNPEAYFQDIGDKIAGQYIFNNPNLNFLCGQLTGPKIKMALAKNYIGERQWMCTLSDVKGNMDDFMGDFEKGGWDSFFEISQKTQNNPIGAYLQAENEMNQQIATRQATKQKELDWGRGFMSFEVCTETNTESNSDAGYVEGQGYVTSSASSKSVNCETQTPGSVIETKLNEVLNIGNNKLAAADEINEIVSALLNQLVGKIVGGIGSGLRALSKPSSTNSNQTFTNQLENSTAKSTVDYFGNTADTSVLDTPLPTPGEYEAAGANKGDLNAGKPGNNPNYFTIPNTTTP